MGAGYSWAGWRRVQRADAGQVGCAAGLGGGAARRPLRPQLLAPRSREPTPPPTTPAPWYSCPGSQFEGSAPGAHSITASLTLRELLAGPQGVDAAAADAALAAAARGEWVPVKASLLQFAQGGPQGSGFKADRLTIGWCVQRLEGCAAGAPPVELCLDKIALVFP